VVFSINVSLVDIWFSEMISPLTQYSRWPQYVGFHLHGFFPKYGQEKHNCEDLYLCDNLEIIGLLIPEKRM